MVRKLIALVIPLNLLMEKALGVINTKSPKKAFAMLVDTMGIEDFIYARELVNVQIRKLQLNQDVGYGGCGELHYVDKSTGYRTDGNYIIGLKDALGDGTTILQHTDDAQLHGDPYTPSETMTQCSVGTQGAGKVGDVPGLEVIFGYLPPCMCGQKVRLHPEQDGRKPGSLLPSLSSRSRRTATFSISRFKI